MGAQEGRPEFRNVASVLTAATLLEGDFGATFGISYERRLGRWYGLGFFADYLTSSSRNVAIGVPSTCILPAPSRSSWRPAWTSGAPAPISYCSAWVWGTTSRSTPAGRLSPEVNIDFEGGYRVYVVGVELGWRF